MHCYACSWVLDPRKDVSRLVLKDWETAPCTGCGKHLYDRYKGYNNHHLTLYRDAQGRIHQERRCVGCHRTGGSLPCYVCGSKHPHGADSRLAVTLPCGSQVIWHYACSDACYGTLLQQLRPLRTGWCRHCNLDHTRSGLDTPHLTAIRYVLIDPTRWCDWLAWRTWFHMRWYGVDGAYEEITEQLGPT